MTGEKFEFKSSYTFERTFKNVVNYIFANIFRANKAEDCSIPTPPSPLPLS